jgi:glucose uptake protein
MSIILRLSPAIFAGILPIWMKSVTKGNFVQQLFGSGIGLFVVALAIQHYFDF